MAGEFGSANVAYPARIARETAVASLSLTTVLGTTPELAFQHAAGGTVFVPSGSSITSLTYYAATAIGGTYLPLNDASGSAVTQTVAAGKAYDLPAACFGCCALKIVANAAGSVDVSLKG